MLINNWCWNRKAYLSLDHTFPVSEPGSPLPIKALTQRNLRRTELGYKSGDSCRRGIHGPRQIDVGIGALSLLRRRGDRRGRLRGLVSHICYDKDTATENQKIK